MKMLQEGESQPKIAQEKDEISVLPDCLLLEILSRLPDTKYAIRTSALSKRWTNLWKLVPSLIFDFRDVLLTQSNSIRSDNFSLVDKTLSQCRQSKLKKFKLDMSYDIQFGSQFNNWIRYAISCNVEELNLVFRYGRRGAEFQLDQSIFINSCFTDLRLDGCMLNPNGAICWKNLRRLKLCISCLNFNEDLIVNILSGSPLLETLELQYYCGYQWAYNPITTLDNESESESKAGMKINALSLNQCPQLNLKKFQLAYCYHSVSESQLNNWIRYAIRCNVKELNLRFHDEYMVLDQILFTSSCITTLRLAVCLVNPVGAISWKNLRSLSIFNGSIDEDLIENILSGSPALETLKLTNCYGYKRLNITSKSVKNLVFLDYYKYDESESKKTFEINAPNILSLTILGHMFLGKLLLQNVSSLIKAHLDYTYTNTIHCGSEEEEEMLKGFVKDLGHVKEIKIEYTCSKAVACMQAKGFIFPSNVKLVSPLITHICHGGASA